MISPIGYTSLKELEITCRKKACSGFKSSDFHKLLEQETIFSASADGQIMKMPTRILSVISGEYVFVDRTTWKISLDPIRDAKRGMSGESLMTGMLILEGEFDEYPGAEFADHLMPYEGWYLVVLDARAKEIIEFVTDQIFEPEIETIEYSSEQELEELFKRWVASFGDSKPPVCEGKHCTPMLMPSCANLPKP